MKVFAIFFLVATLLCGIFWYTDGPDSGMGYATAVFAILGGGTLLYNKVKYGGWLSDGPNLNGR